LAFVEKQDILLIRCRKDWREVQVQVNNSTIGSQTDLFLFFMQLGRSILPATSSSSYLDSFPPASSGSNGLWGQPKPDNKHVTRTDYVPYDNYGDEEDEDENIGKDIGFVETSTLSAAGGRGRGGGGTEGGGRGTGQKQKKEKAKEFSFNPFPKEDDVGSGRIGGLDFQNLVSSTYHV
jgi:hypothetical protein